MTDGQEQYEEQPGSPLEEAIRRRQEAAEEKTRRILGHRDASTEVLRQVGVVAEEARSTLIRDAVVDAVVYELAQLAPEFPVFSVLAGFGQPLPKWVAEIPADELASVREEVLDRICQIVKAHRCASDQQVAMERLGTAFYGHV